MPMYTFKCEKCENQFDELTKYDKTRKYPKVVCPKCGSKEKEIIISGCSFAFSNPVGTDIWNNSHDYRFKHNLPKVLEERQKAEENKINKQLGYKDMDDLENFGEGTHDVEDTPGFTL